MKKLIVVMMVLICGCASIEKYGVTETAIVNGVQLFLKKQKLENLVSDEHTQAVINLVKADLEMQRISAEIQQRIDADVNLQQRIDELAGKYILGGVFIDPDEQAEMNADWDSIIWTSQNYAGAEYDMELRASIGGNDVMFVHEKYSWPVNGSGMDAIACFFVWTGEAWQGGKFEWIRKGGQSIKSLKNIKNGYGGLKAPEKGAKVAFAWVSVDGKLRTNLAEAEW